jgi:23S rRNA (cytidine1920-2'-O)/16S rRNA (cytidine1409-2'-O)-methyltransferase
MKLTSITRREGGSGNGVRERASVFQLHPSLAADPRVAAREATDARSLTPFPEPPSLRVLHRLVPHQPAAADMLAPGLELRLDQRRQGGAGRST